MRYESSDGKVGEGYSTDVSIININLTLDEIIQIIKCGRQVIWMPYFDEYLIKKILWHNFRRL